MGRGRWVHGRRGGGGGGEGGGGWVDGQRGRGARELQKKAGVSPGSGGEGDWEEDGWVGQRSTERPLHPARPSEVGTSIMSPQAPSTHTPPPTPRGHPLVSPKVQLVRGGDGEGGPSPRGHRPDGCSGQHGHGGGPHQAGLRAQVRMGDPQLTVPPIAAGPQGGGAAGGGGAHPLCVGVEREGEGREGGRERGGRGSGERHREGVKEGGTHEHVNYALPALNNPTRKGE